MAWGLATVSNLVSIECPLGLALMSEPIRSLSEPFSSPLLSQPLSPRAEL